MKILNLFLCLLIASTSFAIDDIPSLSRALKTAKPGDTLVLANGTYRDVEISLTGKGLPGKPIVVKAESPGGVIISGKSVLRLAGTAIEVSGFYFTNGYAPKGAIIEFRSGGEVANHCRITNCAIDNYNPANRETEYSWVLLYGRNNRFDHNSLEGKLNQGVTLTVILDEERNQQNNHIIEYNYFGNRPNLGSNGGETIRVGTSQTSMTASQTLIQNNYFEHCDGEVEIVSIKSCDNVVRNNTFFESMGVVALRHGNRNIVEGNVFIGNGKPYTGGIRIINEGHKIRNNHFYGLRGDRFFAALAIMNAVPNSLPNRYHHVKDVEITNNTFIDCDNIQLCVGKDNERTLAPSNVKITHNLFYNKQSDRIYTTFDKVDGFIFENNKAVTRSGKSSLKGFTEVKMSKPVIAKAADKSLCGAAWHIPAKTAPKVLSGNRIVVTPGQNTLVSAVEKSKPGDLIELAEEGEYILDQTVAIRHYLRIQSSVNLKTKPVIRFNGSKGKIPMITIEDGGILELQFLAFNNDAFDGRAAANAAIAPAATMKGHYSADINNCEFYNFHESSFSPFKAQKTTYADTLIFTNCLFRDISGDAIYLAAEKDDAGKYSAEYVEVKNCTFYKVLGHAVDLYRGGSDESTTGPTIIIDHCVLEDVNNKERGAGVRLFGAQNIIVRNTLFSNTGRGGASIKFDETNWDKISVTHCNLYNSGRISSFWGKVITGPMYSLKPVYQSASNFNFSQTSLSPLLNKGTDKSGIGLAEIVKPNRQL